MEPLSPQCTPHPPPDHRNFQNLTNCLCYVIWQDLKSWELIGLEGIPATTKTFEVGASLCCCPISEDLVFSPGPSRELLWASRNFQNIGSTHRSISNNRCYSSVNILRKQKNVDRNFHSWTLGLLFFFPPSSVVHWFLMVFQKVLTFSSDCNQDQQCWRF